MKCIDCPWLKDKACTIPIRPRQCDIRRCNIAVIKRLAPQIKGKVLEIGYGKMDTLARSLEKGTEWYGVDPRWGADDKPRNKYNGKASKIPFADGFFDAVCAYQTMEHWSAFGDTVQDGIKEISRVLRSDGLFSVAVPMKSHGEDMFLCGDTDAIKALFDPSLWSKVEFEEWHKYHDPMPPVRPTGRDARRIEEKTGEKEISSWMLEIRAWRA
jgi:SAM-dependent methyltransferase